eukprot:s2643_g8.t1
MAEKKLPLSFDHDVKEVRFTTEGGEPKMIFIVECEIALPVKEMVMKLDAAFGKRDETKQKESVSLMPKESAQLAPPRYQETSNSTSTRRMERESEKPKSLSLSSTATPTIPQEVPVPQPAPVQPQPVKAPKYSRQTHPDYVKGQRWNRRDKEGEEKKDVFFIDMEAFRNAQFEPLPEPSRKELMHANYKEVDWRIGDVPVPPLVVDNEKENQEPEGDKVAQEHQSDYVPPSRVGAHAEKCAQQ